jgi:hypothetical protein
LCVFGGGGGYLPPWARPGPGHPYQQNCNLCSYLQRFKGFMPWPRRLSLCVWGGGGVGSVPTCPPGPEVGQACLTSTMVRALCLRDDSLGSSLGMSKAGRLRGFRCNVTARWWGGALEVWGGACKSAGLVSSRLRRVVGSTDTDISDPNLDPPQISSAVRQATCARQQGEQLNLLGVRGSLNCCR